MICAHSRNTLGQRHELVAHLRAVAELADSFALPFEAGELAHYLGLLHDLGKFHPDFQEYLLACEAGASRRRRGPDHKRAGAQLARKYLGAAALLIQGHHGGLQTRTRFETWLSDPPAAAAVAEALARAHAALSDLEPAG